MLYLLDDKPGSRLSSSGYGHKVSVFCPLLLLTCIPTIVFCTGYRLIWKLYVRLPPALQL